MVLKSCIRAKQNLELLHLEDIIQRKKPYLPYAVSDFNEKLKAMQSQVAENPRDEILELDEVDYEILDSWTFITCEASVILAAISLMNEVGWPT